MSRPQEKKRQSIKSKLILLILSIIISLLAMQAYNYYERYQIRRASELQANLEIARSLAKAFESFIQDVIHQEHVIGLAMTTSQPMTSRDITRLLETSRDYAAVRDFTWLNPKGDAVYSSNPKMIGINYSDRSYFREIVNGREWMVGELVTAKTTGELAFGISRGVRDGKGTLIGVVFAAVIPEKLEARLGSERSEGGGYAIVDKKGMLVYRYPAIKATWEERNWLKTYPEFGEALKGKEIAATVYAPFEGKNRLVGFTPVPSIGWAASAGQREEEVTGPILSSIGKSALFSLFISLVVFLVALAISRKITDSVAALHAHALALGRGEAKAPEQVENNHVSEFQDLAEAFDTMAEKVQARERDLRASEQSWATTLTSIGDAVIATDTEGRITFMNAVAEQLTGWTLSEAAKKPLAVAFNIINEQTRNEVENPVTKVIREGMIVGLANHTILIRKDGTEIPIDDSGAPIRDTEGRIMGVVLVFRDITARKQAEEKEKILLNRIQEEKDRLSALVNSIPDEVWFADLQKRFALANPAALKEFNLVSDDVDVEELARSLEVYRPDGSPRPAEEAPPLRALNGEVVRNQEEIIRTPASGDLRYRQVSSNPIKDTNNSIIGSVSVVRDITERKRAEQELRRRTTELEASNKEMESFAFSISHDLRAPLRAIDGYLRMILKKQGDKFDEETIRQFNVVRDNAKNMEQLIDDLLAFSRLGRQEVTKTDLYMEELIRDVWQELVTIHPKREMSLTTMKIPVALGDRALIRQVYSNLLGNAVKFTQGRNPAVIEAGFITRDEGTVYYVRDNGIGFDMKFCDKLFGVFSRLHTRAEFEGTGVGLAIVQRIIYRHGGRIWAEAKVDQGATFYFTLSTSQE